MKRLIFVLLLLFVGAQAFAATCKISEYVSLVRDSSGQVVPVAKEPGVTDQSVTYTTSTASAALNESTEFVRIVCDAKAHYQFGSAPTATASDPYVAADTPEYFGVLDTGTRKVAFYDGTS